jgi:hypothetical protein
MNDGPPEDTTGGAGRGSALEVFRVALGLGLTSFGARQSSASAAMRWS